MTDNIKQIPEALERAAAEIAAAGHAGWGNTCADGAAAITALLARLDAAEKDAARYRFIRQCKNDELFIESYRSSVCLMSIEMLDEAVDAAIEDAAIAQGVSE